VEEYRLWRSSHCPNSGEWSSEVGEDAHGPHVAMRRAGFEPLHWRPFRDDGGRVRVISHTCECLATLYELCGAGGACFIRRTVRGPSGDMSSESPRVDLGRTEERWFRLLRGRAR
jgi:hypothetical protein